MDPKIQQLYQQVVSGERSGELFRDDTIASGYDHNASQVFGKDLEQYEADIDFLLDLTTYSPTDAIVDLGCGTGISTLRLSERGPGKIIGLDFSEPMLRQARKKFEGIKNIECMVGSAEELFDVVLDADKVVSANVFQYISNPDRVLQGVYAALSPHGEFLFNVKVKAPKEQSMYFQLFRVLEEVLGEALGKKVTLPELKGLEPKYERTDLEAMAVRNGFTVARYEERPIIYDEKHLRAIYEQALTSMQAELVQALGEEATQRIIDRSRERLSTMYSPEGFAAGTEAYVCLRKTPTP